MSTSPTTRLLDKVLKTHGVSEFNVRFVDIEDFVGLRATDGELYFSSEPTWSPKGWVDCPNQIGRPDDYHSPAFLDPIH